MALTGKPTLNFTTDLQRIVALNSAVGLLTQKMQIIERTSLGIFRNDPFANMAQQAGNASGRLSIMLKHLDGIHTKLVAIGGLNAIGGMQAGPSKVMMTGSGISPITNANLMFQTPATFVPSMGKVVPGYHNTPAFGQDSRYALRDITGAEERKLAGETVRQIAIANTRVGTYKLRGYGTTNVHNAMGEINRVRGLVNEFMPEGSIRDLGLAKVERTETSLLRGAEQARVSALATAAAATRRAEADSRARARQEWSSRNVLIKGHLGTLRDNGSLNDKSEAVLRDLMGKQSMALMANPMGFGQLRLKIASNTYQGFKTNIGTHGEDLNHTVMAKAYTYGQQFDRAAFVQQNRGFSDARQDFSARSREMNPMLRQLERTGGLDDRQRGRLKHLFEQQQDALKGNSMGWRDSRLTAQQQDLGINLDRFVLGHARATERHHTQALGINERMDNKSARAAQQNARADFSARQGEMNRLLADSKSTPLSARQQQRLESLQGQQFASLSANPMGWRNSRVDEQAVRLEASKPVVASAMTRYMSDQQGRAMVLNDKFDATQRRQQMVSNNRDASNARTDYSARAKELSPLVRRLESGETLSQKETTRMTHLYDLQQGFLKNNPMAWRESRLSEQRGVLLTTLDRMVYGPERDMDKRHSAALKMNDTFDANVRRRGILDANRAASDARQDFSARQREMNPLLNELKLKGILDPRQQQRLDFLYTAQDTALTGNGMGWRGDRVEQQRAALDAVNGQRGTALGNRIKADERLAYRENARRDRDTSAAQRIGTITGINNARSKVDDFFTGRAGQKLDTVDMPIAQQLRNDLKVQRDALSARREGGTLAGTGFDSNSVRGVIKGLDSEINKLDAAMRRSNTTVTTLNSGFLKMAGAIVGIQSLRDLFMNATQQAVQFDRTLAQIQARTSRLSDPALRKSFAQSVTNATLADAVRTGMPIAQIAQVQETVHLAANGTFAQKAALGSTINNLALTTDTPTVEMLGSIAPLSKAGFKADDMRQFFERSALFQSRYGVDKSRMNAFYTSFTSGIGAMGPLGDMDTIEAAARQEAAGARDMVMGSKLNRMQTSFMSARTRARLGEILTRGGQRDSLGEVGIDQILNSGNAVLSLDMMSKAYKSGHMSQKELLGVSQTLDMWSGNQTYAMLTKGLDEHRGELRADRTAVSMGVGDSNRAASIAANSIGSQMDRMTNAITVLTVQGITPLGSALKMLMGIVTSVTGSMSKIPGVTETVVSILGILGVALASQKLADVGGEFLDRSISGAGGFVGAVGKAGFIGSAIATVASVGGYFNDEADKAILHDNDTMKSRSAASIPDATRFTSALTGVLALKEQIERADAKGVDTSEMKLELQTKLVAALKGQHSSEAELLKLKSAQTQEMRDQLNISKLLGLANGEREANIQAQETGTVMQQIAKDFANTSGAPLRAPLWKSGKVSTIFDVKDTAAGLPANLVASADAFYSKEAPANVQEAYRNLRKHYSPSMALVGLYDTMGKDAVSPLNDRGVSVETGYFLRGASKEAMEAQRQKLIAATRGSKLGKPINTVELAQASKRPLTGAEFSELVVDAGDAIGNGGASEVEFNQWMTGLNASTRKELKATAGTNLKQYVDLATRLAQTDPAVQKWAAEQNNHKPVDAATMEKFLRKGGQGGAFREAMPGTLQSFANRVGVLGLMEGLNPLDTPVTLERGKGAGSGGGVNYLSILEKFFSGFERAAGQGDFAGFNTMASKFDKTTGRLIGAVDPSTGKPFDAATLERFATSPEEAIRHLGRMTRTNYAVARGQALKDFDATSSGITDPADRAAQRRLVEDKWDENDANAEGMEAKFIQWFSPQGKGKASRKLMEEAYRSGQDERTFKGIEGAYGKIDIASASDEELAIAQLIAKGITAAEGTAALKRLRPSVNTLNGKFGDPSTALNDWNRLSEEQRRDEASARRNIARGIVGMYGKADDLQVSSIKAWGITADMFGSDESKRRVQMQSIGGEQNVLESRLAKMRELGTASMQERLEIETKIKALDIERLKVTEEMAQAMKLKQVGDDVTRQTVATLFTGDPTTRNKSLEDLFTKLPMQGIADSTTKNLLNLGEDNPIGAIARFMFDPGGEMTYKENIAKLDDSIRALIASNDALASAYTGSAKGAEAAYAALPITGDRMLLGASPFTAALNGARFGNTYDPKTGTFVANSAASPLSSKSDFTTSGGMDFSTDLSGFKFDNGLGLDGDSYGFSMSPTGYQLAPGSGAAAQDEADSTAQERLAQPFKNIDPRVAATKQGLYGTAGNAVAAVGGGKFWSSYNAADAAKAKANGKGYSRGINEKGTGLTGAGYAVGAAQVAMGAYSGYAAGKATGSNAAANYGAVGGALGAAGGIMVAVAMTNPVGWVLLAAAALAQMASGAAAAAKAADDKTKAYQKQEVEFQRTLAINEEQRKALGLSADRVLSERADISNAFTGVAASSFLSGRFASNAMQVNVQNLQVVANNPQELSAALAGTFTSQVNRGIN